MTRTRFICRTAAIGLLTLLFGAPTVDEALAAPALPIALNASQYAIGYPRNDETQNVIPPAFPNGGLLAEREGASSPEDEDTALGLVEASEAG